MRNLRDDKSEMPADFTEIVNNWSLESVGAIALEKRLNVLSGKAEDDKASELVRLVRIFFQQTAAVEGKPPLWRYFETKPYKELVKTLDDLTE
jgi:cytochrome P450 family 12